MITHGQVHLQDAHKTVGLLVHLGGAVHERLRRDRRDQHGVADVAGDFRRLAARSSGHPIHRVERCAAAGGGGDRGGFAGLLSLFNIGGRFFWASLSDHIGRKTTYFMFFLLGMAMYALAPWAAHAG